MTATPPHSPGTDQSGDGTKETREFRREHEEVRVARRDGDLTAVFPYATYGARALLNAPCKTEPKGTAFVTKPGPLLEDVMNDLEREHETRSREQRDERHDSSIAIVVEARAAFVDECDEVIEYDSMRFEDIGSTESRNIAAHSNTDRSPETTERPDRVVIHRFSKRDNDPATAPRRVITLRDKRRGRPRTPAGKHGADPPG